DREYNQHHPQQQAQAGQDLAEIIIDLLVPVVPYVLYT
ncbi:hypothetical protein A2U01_0093490, partial [Trifolium medium]|nr:hypothetical protein [Trifolium medium]